MINTAEKRLGTLEPVELRRYWVDEARDFTPWLAQEANLNRLAATLEMDLELEGVEVSVGPYKADIVARDLSSNERVIVENQLAKTNHDHLGKTITYASGLDAKAIIWIASQFTEEHRRACDFLNEHAAPNLRFYGIEMQLWRIGDSPAAPLFKVVARPNDYRSAVVEEQADLTETTGVYLNFWSNFKEFCAQTGTSLSLRKPLPRHWFSFAVGRSTFGLNLVASIQKRRVGCEIYLRGADAKRAFRQLTQQREAIEEATGPLDWQELPARQDCRIIRYRPDVDISNRAQWPDAHQWLKQQAELFHRTFAPRIRALPISAAVDENLDGASTEEIGDDEG